MRVINGIKMHTDSENKLHAYKEGLMIAGNQYSESKTRKDLLRYKLKKNT